MKYTDTFKTNTYGNDEPYRLLADAVILQAVKDYRKALKDDNRAVKRECCIGGVKKIGILLIVAVAAQLDLLISIDSMALRTVAVSYYIANEGFSILENWGAMGLPLPTALKSALAKLRKDDENDSDK